MPTATSTLQSLPAKDSPHEHAGTVLHVDGTGSPGLRHERPTARAMVTVPEIVRMTIPTYDYAWRRGECTRSSLGQPEDGIVRRHGLQHGDRLS
jgi:hypothetical protein